MLHTFANEMKQVIQAFEFAFMPKILVLRKFQKNFQKRKINFFKYANSLTKYVLNYNSLQCFFKQVNFMSKSGKNLKDAHKEDLKIPN